MKNKTVFIVLFFCFLLLTGCGGSPSSEKSTELSEKYDFYKESADNIRRGCDVTSEEADDIFIILVDECGVSDLINYVSNNNDGTFSIWSSGTKYTVALDNGTVSTVFTKSWFSDVQLYPEVEDDEEYAEGRDVTEETETSSDSIPDNSLVVLDFSASDIPYGEFDTGALEIKHGELLSVIYNDGIVVVKAKIQPSFTNDLTIGQNYFNVCDLIKNHGFNSCEELQYWAVADMTNGEEAKVISFDLDKNTINNVYDEKIVENQLGNYVNNLFIHASLTE